MGCELTLGRGQNLRPAALSAEGDAWRGTQLSPGSRQSCYLASECPSAREGSGHTRGGRYSLPLCSGAELASGRRHTAWDCFSSIGTAAFPRGHTSGKKVAVHFSPGCQLFLRLQLRLHLPPRLPNLHFPHALYFTVPDVLSRGAK